MKSFIQIARSRPLSSLPSVFFFPALEPTIGANPMARLLSLRSEAVRGILFFGDPTLARHNPN
jgi:hypothetical protein